MNHPFAHFSTYVVPGAYALGGIGVGILARGLLVPLLAKAAAKTPFRYDDDLIAAIRNPLLVWFILLGVHLALVRLPFEEETHELLRTGIEIAFLLTLTWAAARFGVLAVQTAAAGHARRGVSLVANVVRVVVLLLGLLVILEKLGISVTGIITAVGVGGLAVGLALQDTLSNFFAGLRILIGGKVRPGDFIRLESGLEGTVSDISWSQTTILQPPNNIVLVPNAKMAASVVVNFSLPEQAQNFVVPVVVARASDLDKVETVTMQVARQVLREMDEAVHDFEPRVRFDGFSESGINMNVVLRARHYDMRGPITHRFTKVLLSRFRAEGVELALPVREVTSKDGPQTR